MLKSQGYLSDVGQVCQHPIQPVRDEKSVIVLMHLMLNG
jgi:hypothetical protein